MLVPNMTCMVSAKGGAMDQLLGAGMLTQNLCECEASNKKKKGTGVVAIAQQTFPLFHSSTSMNHHHHLTVV